MPAAVGAARAATAVAAAANVLLQRDAQQRWQRHQRHEHVHRPACANAAATAHAADVPVASRAAASSIGSRAARWLLAAAA